MALFHECLQRVCSKTCLTPPTLLEMGCFVKQSASAVTLITEPFSQCAQNRSYFHLLEEQLPLEDQHPRRLNQQLGEELYLWNLLVVVVTNP
jgi:hypothetical protein